MGPNLFNKYLTGQKRIFLLNFLMNGAKYLIIAGDISDNLNNSILLSKVTGHYDKVC